MKTQLTIPLFYTRLSRGEYVFLFLLFVYGTSFWWLRQLDETVALLDAGIWQLLLLGAICFMSVTALVWWFLQWYWQRLGLPSLQLMVSQFKNLALWQQYAFYWASFALLLLAALLSLIAIL